MKGCVLYGRFVFGDPAKNRPAKTGANAVEGKGDRPNSSVVKAGPAFPNPTSAPRQAHAHPRTSSTHALDAVHPALSVLS
jgi:hypothetical protein